MRQSCSDVTLLSDDPQILAQNPQLQLNIYLEVIHLLEKR